MKEEQNNQIVKPMKLKVTNENGKYKLFLDEKKLHHIMQYKIESLQKGDYAELSIKMIVRYPVTQENVL